MSESGVTVKEFFEALKCLRRTPDGSVVMHIGKHYGLLVVDGEFYSEVVKDLQLQIMMKQTGLDDIRPTTKLLMMFLEGIY